MKILHIRSSNFYGGPERQLHFHCRLAAGSDFDITIGSFSEHDKRPEFLDVIAKDNLAIHTFPVKSAYDLKAVELVGTYLRANQVDIICTHDYRSHFYGSLARKNTTVRWVAFSRGWTKDNIKIRFYCWFDKFIIRFADHIVAVSRSQKKKLEALFIASKNITVIHNAIEPEAFDNVPPVDLRARFGLDKDALVAIAGGRFSAEKGQTDLVRAAAIARSKNAKLVFILFGDGPDLELIKKQIDHQRLSKIIICPGFEKNFIGCLKGADLLINPSLSEGLPNIVLEAMAMKIPCVATDVGGVGEIIENNINGLLVPPGSPKTLAEAIIKMADRTFSTTDMSDSAYQTIVGRFSFSSQFEKLTTLYRTLVKA